MLLLGILFILLGIYIINIDKYYIEDSEEGKILKKKDEFKRDNFYRFKLFIGIFSIVIGVFSILNYIIY